MRTLRHFQLPIFLVLLVVATWTSLWLVYDASSPVYQYFRNAGSAQIDDWSATELSRICLRLEPAGQVTPPVKPDVAQSAALRDYPDAFIREIVLISATDTCATGVNYPKLAYAVVLEWPQDINDPLPTGQYAPKAIVIVDAVSGTTITRHLSGLP